MKEFVIHESVKPHWMPAAPRFWYRNDLPGGRREFILADAERGSRAAAFDHAELARSLAAASGRTVTADRLPFERLQFSGDGKSFVVTAFEKTWVIDPETAAVQPGTDAPDAAAPAAPAPKILDGPRPSRRNGGKTKLTFVNKADESLELVWIDPSGEQKSYGVIAANDENRLETFVGHVWLIRTTRGRRLGVVEAVEEDSSLQLDGGPLPMTDDPPRSRSSKVSPDGKYRAFLREDNLFVRDLQSGNERRLSENGSAADPYEETFYWSPDSQKLVVFQTLPGDDRQIHLIESSPPNQLQPIVHQLPYAKPGDRVPQRRPRLFDVAEGKSIPVAEANFENSWSVDHVHWRPASDRFSVLFNQRGHQILRLISIDAQTGAAKTLIEECSPTFIDYAQKFYLRRLDDSDEILWLSERDGWNHLYLFDGSTGALKNQVTRGDWAIRKIDRIDEKERRIWFRAGGLDADQDPYHVHYASVHFDGSGLTRLTAGDGTHRADVSPDGRFLIDTYSRVDLPPVTELRRTEDGSLVCVLERGDAAELLASGWRPPERFVAPGRDGKTPIYGIIIRPQNFDPQRKYPVVEEIYAGPQSAYVPKGWNPLPRQRALADLGFIVVQIDGMGTSHRSKAFHDVCWKNLGDAGFPDRIAWIKAAAATRPEMDLSRVGIYGGSAGGQNAVSALIRHPDFYKVAVADCGCHDNRMDKIWWNELWMGPLGPHYDDASNVTQAHRLNGKLLLIVGELDRNVDPASTMQLANALIKAEKKFDLLVMPGVGHGAAETPYASKRRTEFLVRELLATEPPPQPSK